MVWIAFFVWFILWLLFYVNNEYIWMKMKYFYNLLKPEVLPGTEHVHETFQNLCKCPAAFPVEQRFSDGKTCVGVKGSYNYSLPLSCCFPLDKCSSPLPPYFPKNVPSWDGKSWQNPPIEKKERVIVVDQPTLRDLTGVGPRSYWCYEGQSKDGEPKCKRHIEDPLHPAKNQCGSPMVSQVPNTVFTSERQCKESSNPCYGLGYDKCVLKTGCGWCEELGGKGSCRKGTPEGPLDVTLTCAPSTQLATGSWTPGTPDDYILEEPISHDDSWEFNPEVQPHFDALNDPIADNSKTWAEWKKQMVPPALLKRNH